MEPDLLLPVFQVTVQWKRRVYWPVGGELALGTATLEEWRELAVMSDDPQKRNRAIRSSLESLLDRFIALYTKANEKCARSDFSVAPCSDGRNAADTGSSRR